MLPAGPLMIEHRLIERMIKLLKENLLALEEKNSTDTDFIETAVDFLRTYADKCHHGKEEDILFRELAKKEMKEEHKKIMEGLIEDHKFSRNIIGELTKANENYKNGDSGSLVMIKDSLKKLTDLYPRHIATEDKDFFLAAMDYFNDGEKKDMLDRFWDFDKTIVHIKYKEVVEKTENKKGRC
jgi:hemerythrin-like domain-containing protein